MRGWKFGTTGQARFVDFPLFNAPLGGQRFPKKTTEDSRWSIVSKAGGYRLLMSSSSALRFEAVEGGRPSDLMVKPHPVGFSKWRKVEN